MGDLFVVFGQPLSHRSQHHTCSVPMNKEEVIKE
jgi:hypothetical protein